MANRTVVSSSYQWVTTRITQGTCLQVLVTHHVELVLPGTHYLVRMLDGRIDAKGTVKDLRAQGLLDEITQEAALEAHEEQIQAEHSTEDTVEAITDKPTDIEAKKPRKLIKDEHRETGGVKWSIYKSYLKASYVQFFGRSSMH